MNEFTELLAVIFAIIYVVLAAKTNRLCWVAGFISSLLYIILCYNAGLYAESILQVFYVIMAVYGYINWSKTNLRLQIVLSDTKQILKGIVISFVTGFILGYFLKNYTQASWPYTDSQIFAFSIWATYLSSKVYLISWIVWIVVDFVSIGLYYDRAMKLTAILYIIYTLLAIWGYYEWLKLLRKRDENSHNRS